MLLWVLCVTKDGRKTATLEKCFTGLNWGPAYSQLHEHAGCRDSSEVWITWMWPDSSTWTHACRRSFTVGSATFLQSSVTFFLPCSSSFSRPCPMVPVTLVWEVWLTAKPALPVRWCKTHGAGFGTSVLPDGCETLCSLWECCHFWSKCTQCFVRVRTCNSRRLLMRSNTFS